VLYPGDPLRRPRARFCREPFRVTGRVSVFFELPGPAGPSAMVDDRTRFVTRLRIGGEPYLPPGSVVTVVGRRCRTPDGGSDRADLVRQR
jgi:hypothetical protein